MRRPLAIDLFCGLGGWAEGLLAEGWDVGGFDIEQHVYGEHRYPGLLVVQDVLTLHGSQFRTADLIVASPPCQEYSYMAMPWKKAKAKAAAIRADKTGQALEKLNRLFDACFRIQREACMAAGRHIPLIVENVRGAQPWVGRSRWSFGSFHLWGDVPALMPIAQFRKIATASSIHRGDGSLLANIQFGDGIKGAHGTSGAHWTNPAERALPEGVKQRGSGHAWFDKALDERRKNPDGVKVGGGAEGWFGKNPSPMRQHHSGSSKRRFASAMIAKIPLPLSRHIGATFRATA